MLSAQRPPEIPQMRPTAGGVGGRQSVSDQAGMADAGAGAGWGMRPYLFVKVSITSLRIRLLKLPDSGVGR